MKRLLTAALLCISSYSFAQSTVARTGKMPHSNIIEKYSVLKSDKSLRQGRYTASLNNVDLVTGFYLNGEKAGIWNYYNPQGKLVQTYNYTDNQATYTDSTATKSIQYYLTGINQTDAKSMPAKAAGSITDQR